MLTCSINDCDKEIKARDLCCKHLHRHYRGQPLTKKSCYDKTDEERFWEQVNKSESDDCWLWTGSTRGKKDLQYGFIWLHGKRVSAHRYSYILANGEIPQGGDYRGMCICHTCDITLCVNPEHLFLGTHTDNMRDKIAKGRCFHSNKTHCPYGHEYTVENTYVSKKGLRHCRACHANRERIRQHKL